MEKVAVEAGGVIQGASKMNGKEQNCYSE